MKIRGGVKRVKGTLRVPSDKSISHRAVILGAIAHGKTRVKRWLRSADTLATLEIMRSLGARVDDGGEDLIVEGRDYNFTEPSDILDARNSGTTARIVSGVISTQPFFSVITGDQSLRQRPMGRVVKPLRQMGARIDGREDGNKLPVSIRGGGLKAISFFNEKSSAQVKSSILLAGLKAEGVTEVVEPVLSRDHTERMLKAFGVELIQSSEGGRSVVRLEGGQRLEGTEVFCPADPSSAAFFCALCLLVPEGDLILKEVLLNPTRDGFYRKLKEMGAQIEYLEEREISGERIADIRVTGGGRLKGAKVIGEEIPSMIDEIPILAVLMATAEGMSEVRGAQELRVKESDRIKSVVENLRAMGVEVEEFEDGFRIEGVERLKGSSIKTYHDHRIAMAFAVAGMVAEGETHIDAPECVEISYPEFFDHLHSIVEYA